MVVASSVDSTRRVGLVESSFSELGSLTALQLIAWSYNTSMVEMMRLLIWWLAVKDGHTSLTEIRLFEVAGLITERLFARI